VLALARIVLRSLADLAGLVVVSLRPRRSVEAENRFLRGELALYQQSGLMPRRVYAATRVCPRTVRNHAHAIVAVIE